MRASGSRAPTRIQYNRCGSEVKNYDPNRTYNFTEIRDKKKVNKVGWCYLVIWDSGEQTWEEGEVLQASMPNISLNRLNLPYFVSNFR